MPSSYKKGYSDKKAIEYIKNNYDQFSLRVPKGDREKYKKLAEEQGQSLNQLIVELLDEEVQRVLKERQVKRAQTYEELLDDKIPTENGDPNHKSFEERLDEYGGKIAACDFDWGEALGRELL